jgi:DNA-binding NarL/FixJ family response regulator
MTVSVLIADDQALVRTGFRMILETDPEAACPLRR